ncbi:MAG TPA: PAS domain-containing protein, partial [Candidatus Sabulitectum sp.]|nr:PAS domain-containing protein [Candidatus Sabulitectum sp.]
MNQGAGAWIRLSFTPSTGRLSVEGDPYSVLGKTREELTGATDPLSALPASVAGALVEGSGVTRDTELNLVLVPGDTRYSNSVTVILEKGHEYDLVSDMASGVAAFSTDGNILRWNRRMSYLFGPREEDVKGKNVEDILPPPVLYNWNSILSSVHLGHEVRLEFRPSGEKKLEGILSRGGPGIIGIFSDSSENYNTTKRLRALNRLNQAYIQSTETGLILLDTGLRVLLCNPGFERISGRKGSLIGLQLHDVLPDDSYRWVHEAWERLLGEERAEQSALVPFKVEGG